jgi:hypothetical protein
MPLFSVGESLRMTLRRWFGQAEQDCAGERIDQSKLCLLGSSHPSEFLTQAFKRSGNSLFHCIESCLPTLKLISDRGSNQGRGGRISPLAGFFCQTFLVRVR